MPSAATDSFAQSLPGHVPPIAAVKVSVALSARHSLGYPLLSDPDRRVAAEFGVKRGLAMLPNRRATFVIDTDRTLLFAIRDREGALAVQGDDERDRVRTLFG